MADRGRDLKVSILSDVDKFDVDPAAQGFDDLADAAKKGAREVEGAADKIDASGKSLNRLGDQAKATAGKVDSAFDKIDDSGKKVDSLGDQAKDTANKNDNAFHAIAKSAKSAARKANDGKGEARKGLADFKDEAGGSGREAAASFSGGFDSVTDFVQETAANAFAGMGKVGAAAGIAAAVGIGILTSQLEASKERIKEIRDALFQLGQDGADAFERQKDALDRLQGQGELANYRDAVRNVGASWADFVAGMSGDDAALERVRVKADEAANAWGGTATAWDDAAKGGQVLTGVIGEQRDATALANADLDAYNAGPTATATVSEETSEALQRAAENAAAAQQAYADTTKGAFQTVGDAAGTLQEKIQEKAQKEADATKDTKDSWADYADGVELSAADVAATLDKQTKALEDFRKNMLTVQKRGDEEFLAWVSQQPPAVAQAYASGTAAQRNTIYNAYKRNVGARAAQGIADGLDGGKAAVAGVASGVHAAAKAALGQKINVPVGVKGPTAGEIGSIRRSIQGGLSGITVGVTAIAKTVSTRSVP